MGFGILPGWGQRLISDDAIATVTIWQEARGENYAGKVAVGEVIRRRAALKFQSDGTIVGTCLYPYAFSGWNTKDPNRRPSLKIVLDNHVVEDCAQAWHDSLSSNLVPGAVYYCNLDILPAAPDWATPEKFVAKIGNQSFFRS